MSSASAQSDPYFDVSQSAKGRKWVRRKFDRRHVDAMVQHGLDPALAEVLSARGVLPEQAERYLAPRLRDYLPDPSTLKDMDIAATQIAEAVIADKPVGIFGDYDVDGTTSSALLARYFRELGVEAHVHLPDRATEGYGPNMPAFRALAEQGAQLILTVDCGATAHTVLHDAKGEGFDVIVLDHHLMEGLPAALAIVNPNRPDDESGLGDLSAGGVVFLTLVAVNRALRQAGWFEARPEPNLLQWLDLVALSLVCDVMPLRGLTRVLVRQGLCLIKDFDTPSGGNPGLFALAEEAGAKGPAMASHFGFSIGPRINAAGRIGHARLAFDILTTDDTEKAKQLAQHLGALNGARQGVEQDVLAEAVALAEEKGGRDQAAPLVVAGDGWHAGVIGIVAGRLKERFDRPTFAIAFDGDEGKGSGRSVPGVDLGLAIGRAVAAGVIEGGGGHPMAAGLSLRRDQLAQFETWLAETLAEQTAQARLEQVFRLDGRVSAAGVTASFAQGLEAAGPFGNGNPEPRFVLADVRIMDLRILKERHIALTVRDGMGRPARCIVFGCVGEPLGDFLQAAQDGRPIHLAGRVKPDDWRGGNCGQFQVEDAADGG